MSPGVASCSTFTLTYGGRSRRTRLFRDQLGRADAGSWQIADEPAGTAIRVDILRDDIEELLHLWLSSSPAGRGLPDALNERVERLLHSRCLLRDRRHRVGLGLPHSWWLGLE